MSRYLVKGYKAFQNGKIISPTFNHLKQKIHPSSSKSKFINPSDYTRMFGLVAKNMLAKTVEHLESDKYDAWNDTTIELTQVTQAHMRYYVVKCLNQVLVSEAMGHALHKVFVTLFELLVTHWMLINLGDFVIYGDMDVSVVF